MYISSNGERDNEFEKFIIISNGVFDPQSLSDSLDKRYKIVALDGAADRFYAYQIKPDYIIGDLDSITPEVQKYFNQKAVPIIHVPDQNFTDLEKGIAYCDSLNAKQIIIKYALGGHRSDHELMAYSCLKKYYKLSRSLQLHTNSSIIEYLRDQKIMYSAHIGDNIGIFGFPKGKVISHGLQWELKNTFLELGQYESCSNRVVETPFSLDVMGEVLLSRSPHSIIRQNKV